MQNCESEEKDVKGEDLQTILTNGGISTLSAVLRALSHQHRRYILYYLEENDTASLDELAQYIEEVETNNSTNRLPSEYDEIRLQLHHTHIPKLVDAHLVDYDPRTHIASYSIPPESSKKVVDLMKGLENVSHDT